MAAAQIKVRTIIVDGDLTVTLDPDALDDWEFMQLMEADKLAAATKHLLGEKQLAKVQEHYRDAKTGRIKASDMAGALKTIVEKAAPNS